MVIMTESIFYGYVVNGFELGVALWWLGRFLSYGVQLLKHMLDCPKDEI